MLAFVLLNHLATVCFVTKQSLQKEKTHHQKVIHVVT